MQLAGTAWSGKGGDGHGRLTQVSPRGGEDPRALEADQLSARQLRGERRGPRAHRRYKDEHRAVPSHWSSSATIDFGGSSTVSLSPETRTPLNGSGCTVVGWSKVL